MDISLFVFNSDNLKLLKFPDVELNPGPRAAAPVRCRLLCCNIRGLHCNIKDLTVASSGFDVIMCSETFVSRQRHMSELRIPGFSRPVQLYRDSRPRVRGMAVYVRDGFSASLASSYSCNCCEMQIVRVCGGRMNLVYTVILILMTIFLTVLCLLCHRFRKQTVGLPLFSLAILMRTMPSGWGLLGLTVMV